MLTGGLNKNCHMSWCEKLPGSLTSLRWPSRDGPKQQGRICRVTFHSELKMLVAYVGVMWFTGSIECHKIWEVGRSHINLLG